MDEILTRLSNVATFKVVEISIRVITLCGSRTQKWDLITKDFRQLEKKLKMGTACRSTAIWTAKQNRLLHISVSLKCKWAEKQFYLEGLLEKMLFP